MFNLNIIASKFKLHTNLLLTRYLISMKYILFISIICFFFLFNELLAQDSVLVEICLKNYNSVEELDENCFEKYRDEEIEAKRFWLKVIVYNEKNDVLLFSPASKIKMFYADTSFITGMEIPKESRSIKGTFYALPVPAYGEPIYVEVTNNRDRNIFLQLGSLSYNKFHEDYVVPKYDGQRFQFIFQGMLWIILLYNLLLFITIRDKVYLSYSVYLLGLSIYSLQNQSLALDLFFYKYPNFSLPFSALGITLGLYGFIIFMLAFLPEPTINKKWRAFFHFLLLFTVLAGIFYEFTLLYMQNITWFIYSTFVGAGISFLSLLVFFVYLIIKHWKYTIVKFFVIGSFFIVTGALITTISQVYGGITYYWLQLGGLIEVLIFSLGLGVRMKNIEKEQALFLEKQNQILEQRVSERTREISINKEEILVQNEELQQQQEEITTQRDQIELQNNELIKSNRNFMDSVRYAQTIQEAILPFKERLETYFEDYFIIFKPKDVVSGDFYWVHKTEDPLTKEEIILIGVLDCTGHGVPGAFISIIGFTLLNEIVAKEHIVSPAKILEQLNIKIKKALKQEETNNQDGMDAALCMLRKKDSSTYQLTFAGAKRPLYFVKNNEFVEWKGDRSSIGGTVRKDKQLIFNEQQTELSSKDILYLFTDGFSDQNGTNGQKMGSLKFQSYLEELHDLPFHLQKQKLENQFKSYKGKNKQRDDVTILGFELR